MALPPIDCICTKCASKFNEVPERSFLGFQKLTCPTCQEKLTYPLTKGYRTTYWVIFGLMVLMVIKAFSQGSFVYPGGFGLAVIFALLRDRSIRKRVSIATSQSQEHYFSGDGQIKENDSSLPMPASRGISDEGAVEENAYARAADELETDQVEKATWARAFSEADGDVERTKARYIALRVKKLIAQGQTSVTGDQLQLGNAKQEPTDQNIHSTSHGSASLIKGQQNADVDDVANNQKMQEENKARLWKEAQVRIQEQTRLESLRKPLEENEAGGHSAGASAKESSTSQHAMYEAYLGEKNQGYYLSKFEQFDSKAPGLHPSWNWAAFFFNCAWALYRKMYGWFFVFFVVFCCVE